MKSNFFITVGLFGAVLFWAVILVHYLVPVIETIFTLI